MALMMLDFPRESLNGAQRTPLRANRVQRIGKSAFYLHVPRAGTGGIRQDATEKRVTTKILFPAAHFGCIQTLPLRLPNAGFWDGGLKVRSQASTEVLGVQRLTHCRDALNTHV